ncbi:uncharacterized protein LOC131618065 [Vicia villosa]|uniref:uncharacterized protein LOC131618065 n=1 Tax=Vicia villosa TaxID=3911 RepID=UPI00273C4A44|nr:uncharacterized protein LOC131618065 [Vicia villosa]
MDRNSDSDSKSHDHAYKNMNQNSNNTESCNVISKPLLPEDLIFDILTFVPLICLINSARHVCKTWAATITSFGFSEAHKRRARYKHGLYVESFMTGVSSYFLEFNDDVINGEFERTYLGIPQGMGKIISSCEGLLLLLNTSGQVFLVNPILKRWLRIPPFPSSRKHGVFRPQCTIVRVPCTSEFKLFLLDIVTILNEVWYVFYVLRIGIDNSWKVIAKRELLAPHGLLFSELIHNGGDGLYWKSNDEITDILREIDVDKEIIITREYPVLWRSNILWMGKYLSCITSCEDLSRPFQVFILDSDSREWSRYHEMGPFDYVAACGHELDVRYNYACFRLWINDLIIFDIDKQQNRRGANTQSPKNIYFGYNIKTRKLTKIEGIDMGSFEVWLHTNSLASLPSMATDV